MASRQLVPAREDFAMQDAGGKNKKVTITIRQMEIDDVSAVYHMGEELFTSDEFPF